MDGGRVGETLVDCVFGVKMRARRMRICVFARVCVCVCVWPACVYMEYYCVCVYSYMCGWIVRPCVYVCMRACVYVCDVCCGALLCMYVFLFSVMWCGGFALGLGGEVSRKAFTETTELLKKIPGTYSRASLCHLRVCC